MEIFLYLHVGITKYRQVIVLISNKLTIRGLKQIKEK